LIDRNVSVDELKGQHVGDSTPGCAVGVLKKGELIHAKGYGLLNLDYGTPIRPDTAFHVASLFKQFTAFAICLFIPAACATSGNCLNWPDGVVVPRSYVAAPIE
jgi:hypothetical protein